MVVASYIDSLGRSYHHISQNLSDWKHNFISIHPHLRDPIHVQELRSSSAHPHSRKGRNSLTLPDADAILLAFRLGPKVQVPTNFISSSHLIGVGRSLLKFASFANQLPVVVQSSWTPTSFFPLESGVLWTSTSVNPSL